MTLDDTLLPLLSAVFGGLAVAATAGVMFQRIRSDVDRLKDSAGTKVDVDNLKALATETKLKVEHIEGERAKRSEQVLKDAIAQAEQKGELNQRLKTLEEDRSKVAGEIASVEGRLRGEIRSSEDNILSHFDRTVEIINAHAVANGNKEQTGNFRPEESKENKPRQRRPR